MAAGLVDRWLRSGADLLSSCCQSPATVSGLSANFRLRAALRCRTAQRPGLSEADAGQPRFVTVHFRRCERSGVDPSNLCRLSTFTTGGCSIPHRLVLASANLPSAGLVRSMPTASPRSRANSFDVKRTLPRGFQMSSNARAMNAVSFVTRTSARSKCVRTSKSGCALTSIPHVLIPLGQH